MPRYVYPYLSSDFGIIDELRKVDQSRRHLIRSRPNEMRREHEAVLTGSADTGRAVEA
jgi:hypothetical protein